MDSEMLCDGIILLIEETHQEEGDFALGKLTALRDLIERYIEPHVSGNLHDRMNDAINNINQIIADQSASNNI